MYTCHQSNLAKSGSKNIAWTTYDVVNNAWTLRGDNYLTTLIKDAGKERKKKGGRSRLFL